MNTRWLRRNLLWVDGSAGAIVGVGMLALSTWLSAWYRLPVKLLVGMGIVNLIYAAYSLSRAPKVRRPPWQITALVVGNSTWAVVCIAILLIFRASASVFGAIHLVAEAFFVGGLAQLEWRWRRYLSDPLEVEPPPI